MKAALLHNPGLMISLGLLLGGALICGLFAGLTVRSGASLKGIAFFAGFFAIVVLPQVAGQLALAVKPTMAKPPVSAETMATGSALSMVSFDSDRLGDPMQVFGADVALGSPFDARPMFDSRMPGLRKADAVHWSSGDSVTMMIFASASHAASGLLAYLALYRVAPTLDRGGTELQGERGLGGGWVKLIRSGGALLVVTALDEPALQARLAAIPLLRSASERSPIQGRIVAAGEPLVPALQPLVRLLREHALLQAAAVVGLAICASWWFFAGTAWAGRVPRERAALPQTAAELKARLLAVNQAGVPVEVSAVPDGRIAVT
jgi:hypothetical protein